MPPGSSVVVTATILSLVGFLLAILGAVTLPSRKGLGLALMAGGLVVVVIGGWVSTSKRRTGGDDGPRRGA